MEPKRVGNGIDTHGVYRFGVYFDALHNGAVFSGENAKSFREVGVIREGLCAGKPRVGVVRIQIFLDFLPSAVNNQIDALKFAVQIWTGSL